MTLYRGQREDWALKPSGYRDIPPESELKKFSQSLIRNSKFFKSDYRIVANLIFEVFHNYNLAYEPKMPELKALLQIKSKDTLIKGIDDFMIRFLGLNGEDFPFKYFLEDLSYFQHYKKKTPMLDFTEDFDSALKFAAVDSIIEKEDGFIEFKDTPIQVGQKATLFVFCPELCFKEHGWSFSHLHIWDSGTNENIKNQKGVCVFCPPSDDDNVFLFMNCYQVYNLFHKTKVDFPILKLSDPMIDELYTCETLYRLGSISKEMFEHALGEFGKQLNR